MLLSEIPKNVYCHVKLNYSASSDSVQCELCEEAAKYLKNMLDSNTTQEELEDFLDKACNLLPDTVTAQVRPFESCHEKNCSLHM